VALSGDGGDELFAGYPRYYIVERLWRMFGVMPLGLRRAVAAGLNRLPEPLIDRAFAALPWQRFHKAGGKVHRFATLIAQEAEDALFVEIASIWPNTLVPAARGGYRLGIADDLGKTLPDAISRMQYYDTLAYLPDDILTKVDRCSMAVALEAREPMLDHRLVEFAWRLPAGLKHGGGQTKRLLRRVLHRYVPAQLVERPKMGFSIPLANWLRHELRDWAENLLAKKRLAADGIFAPDAVRRLWDEHQARAANREHVLWNVLMFQAWKEHYRV
jgi:asparagine synthase (glutamine-hydrolysing)